MRLVNAAQRFVNVFAVAQSRAVVVIVNAMEHLLHLMDAHLGTKDTDRGGKPRTRCPKQTTWRMGEISIRFGESRIPAYAPSSRPSSLPQTSR